MAGSGSVPSPFVLVHGGRHGGWCWARVAPLLRAAGHEVHTPTLTALGERALVHPPDDAAHYGVTDPADAAWLESRMTAQPLKTYHDPVGPTDRAGRRPGVFVECVPSSLEPHVLERARARSVVDPTWHYRVLATSHDAMVTAPKDVAELLLEALDLTEQ